MKAHRAKAREQENGSVAPSNTTVYAASSKEQAPHMMDVWTCRHDDDESRFWPQAATR